VYTLRFDMRAPSSGARSVDLYRAALEMTAWAESRGAVAAIVCEHHGQGDGYLPAPMILASALAARTTSIQIVVAAVVLPLHDPVQLAEEMVVLDIISGGRLSYVAALGYQRDEYEMLGVDFSRRGRIADDYLAALLAAKTGRPFDYGGRTVTVTPPPLTEGGPNVAWGGGSEAAAKRAGRFGLDFFAQSGDEALRTVYEAAAQAAGHAPRSCFLPPNDAATTLFVADDLDAAWEELGPYLLHDAQCYAAMNPGKEGSTSFSFATTIDELRAEDRSHRIVTVSEAVSMVRSGEVLALHPLVGGLPPALAFPYLRRVADEVMASL